MMFHFIEDSTVIPRWSSMAPEVVKEELKRITPPNVELLKLADRFPAPQEWYDE